MARRGAPKRRFPARRCDPRLAYALVHDELLLDGVARMNLATFCTTWAEPEALRLLAESFDKNIVDKDEYPQTAELEARCVRMLADLWQLATPGHDARHLDDGLQRGGDALRPGGEVPLARAPPSGRRATARSGRTSCAARCRSAGRSSRATSTSRSARCRWTASAT